MNGDHSLTYSQKNIQNKKYNCSGLPAFKSRRVGYQSNQKLLTASISALKQSALFIY